MGDVIVIGAGLSGLTAAWKLQQRRVDLLVLEAADAPGGRIRTPVVSGCRLETGPNSFMGSAEHVWRLTEEAGLLAEIEPAAAAARSRYVFRDGRLSLLPSGPLSFISTPLLSWPAKLRLLLEPVIPNRAAPGESAWDFFVRRFGREAAAYMMSPFISGIYAGDPERLGARAAFPKFWGFEKESGSMVLGGLLYLRRKKRRLASEGRPNRTGLFTYRNGLETLISRLATDLNKRLLTRHAVQGIESDHGGYRVRGRGFDLKARCLVLATPPNRTAGLLDRMSPDCAACLRSVPLASVAVVHWSQPCACSGTPRGFGFLVPRINGPRVLGTIFSSQVFPRSAPPGRRLFTSFYGGMLDPTVVDLSDGALKNLLFEDQTLILGRRPEEAEVLRVSRQTEAIPQLLPYHPEKMAGASRALEQTLPGVRLAGSYLTGVSMDRAIANGYRAFVDILRLLLERVHR